MRIATAETALASSITLLLPEWWSYTLADFLLFAPRTYHRLFELHNRDVWPAHVLALALGATLLASMQGREAWRGRVVAAILAACWLWVGGSFQLQRYATINWAATWFAAAFALQALLFAWMALTRGPLEFRSATSWRWRAGAAVVALALLAMPFAAPLSGQGWLGAEVFGITPDPTAIATVGALLAARAPRVLALVPALWCTVSGATLLAIGSPTAMVLFAAAALAVAAVAPRRDARPADASAAAD